jgi:Domain of unknown function (DUF5668)
MNCANHIDVASVAYCRTCGKPLCANCSRDVRGVIFCESCLAERLQGGIPQAATGVIPPVVPVGSSGPNPAVAGILAGFFPFGVGAVYTGQYAKGLAHLLIFVGLIWGLSSGHGSFVPVLGISLGFFVVYQIIDAVRSAKALQMGQPAPDPFGLAYAFGTGEKVDTSKVPTAAVVLIGLGVLFLLQTSIGFDVGKFWPVLLIGLGVWLFARRQGMLGLRLNRYGRPYRAASLVGPAVLVTVGGLSLIENLDGPGWDRTWPVLLLVIGLAKLLERHTPPSAGIEPPSSAPGITGGPSNEVSPPPSSEVKNG